MRPDRLNYLNRFDKFYKTIIEQAKQNNISESEFYLVMIAKLKGMERERREKRQVAEKNARI